VEVLGSLLVALCRPDKTARLSARAKKATRSRATTASSTKTPTAAASATSSAAAANDLAPNVCAGRTNSAQERL
jgi:hypothetical protein